MNSLFAETERQVVVPESAAEIWAELDTFFPAEIMDQVQETLWFLQQHEMDAEAQKFFLESAKFLGERYSHEEGGARIFQTRKYETRNGKPEYMVNHFFRVVDILFGVLAEMEKNPTEMREREKRAFKILANHKFEILATALFHDFVEDRKGKMSDLRTFLHDKNQTQIVEANLKIGQSVFLLTRRGDGQSIKEYVANILQNEDSVARILASFVKFLGDQMHNLQSHSYGSKKGEKVKYYAQALKRDWPSFYKWIPKIIFDRIQNAHEDDENHPLRVWGMSYVIQIEVNMVIEK